MATNNAINNTSTPFTSDTTFNVSSTGIMTNTKQPAFFYFNTTNRPAVTGDGTLYTIIFDGLGYDNRGDFDGVSTFTAPVTGVYCFSTSVYLQFVGAGHTIAALIMANPVTGSPVLIDINPFNVADANNNLIVNTTYQIGLTATQTMQVQVEVFTTPKTIQVQGGVISVSSTTFSGFLVG